MSKSLDNYIGITDAPFDKFEKSMKISDDILKQYFDLATDLPTEEIKERYLRIANGGIPQDIEVFEINENTINICDLLVRIGFSNSKSEAKRMILGRGVKLDSVLIEDVNKSIKIKNEKVIQFGKNKFKKVIFK